MEPLHFFYFLNVHISINHKRKDQEENPSRELFRVKIGKEASRVMR